jgi:predicted RecA/RadA family phage recombinase
MKNYVQAGDTVTVVAPSTVVSGQSVLVGDLFGVAVHDAASGTLLEICTQGVVTLRKAAGTINPGVRVFWDAGASRVTTTATSNRCIGYHVGTTANSGADNTDITVLLRPNTPAGT